MLSEAIQYVAGKNLELVLYFLIPVLTLLFWRLWTFTMMPWLEPHRPRYLPYWIPFIGHALPFFKNSTALYAKGRKYFGNSSPWMLYIMGEKIAIVTAPAEVSKIFNDDSSFSFDPFIETVYKGVGNVSKDGLKILWRTPQEGFQSLWPNPKGQVLVHTGNAILHRQLLQPERFQKLSEMVLKYIEEYTRWDSFFQSSVIASTPNMKVVSLHRWCRDVLITAQTRSFFGKHLLELEPRLTQLFDEWDINAWMITYQYPKFMAKAAIQPRDTLIAALTRYLETPRDKRADCVPFVNELEDEERNAGLCSEDCARILMIILWGINSNVQMSTFWNLVHLLQQPELISLIRKEIAPVMQKIEPLERSSGEQLVNLAKLELFESCPLLDSAVSEVLRVTSTGSSVRKVTKPVIVGGKSLPVGIKVLLPQRPLLLSTEGFGPNACQVDLSRFVKANSKHRPEFYRPYGGGITMCSGKVLGKREICVFVALTLWRYDIQVIGDSEEVLGVRGKIVPRLDQQKLSIGVAKQVEGDDMIVKVLVREVVQS